MKHTLSGSVTRGGGDYLFPVSGEAKSPGEAVGL